MCDICYPPLPPGSSQSNTTNGGKVTLIISASTAPVCVDGKWYGPPLTDPWWFGR